MKHKTIKLDKGYYSYRGYNIESSGTPSYPSWGISKEGEMWSEDYRDTLKLAKWYVDVEVERGSGE